MIETSRDWNIRKKLDETRRVYVMPARANGKTYTQFELYSELMAQNKEIKVIRAEDIRKAVELLKPKTEPVPDFDFIEWFERSDRAEVLGNYLDESFRSKTWEPIIRYDIWAYDEGNLFREEQMHWLKNRYMIPTNQYLPTVYVIDKSKLD